MQSCKNWNSFWIIWAPENVLDYKTQKCPLQITKPIYKELSELLNVLLFPEQNSYARKLIHTTAVTITIKTQDQLDKTIPGPKKFPMGCWHQLPSCHAMSLFWKILDCKYYSLVWVMNFGYKRISIHIHRLEHLIPKFKTW